MAYSFQGKSKSSREWGMVTKVEIKPSGGSYQDVGYIEDMSDISITPITRPGDPADTQLTVALRISFTIVGTQTAKASELANIDDGTGLFDTDAVVKFTLTSGRTRELGALYGYPLRVVAGYAQGGNSRTSYITYTATHVEPYDSTNNATGVAGKFSA